MNALDSSKEFLKAKGIRESELERVNITFETHDGQSVDVSWHVKRGSKGLEWLDVLSNVLGDDFSYTLKIYPTLGAEVTDVRINVGGRELILEKTAEGGLQTYLAKSENLPAADLGDQVVFFAFHNLVADQTVNLTFRDDRGSMFMADIDPTTAEVMAVRLDPTFAEHMNEKQKRVMAWHAAEASEETKNLEAPMSMFDSPLYHDGTSPVNTDWADNQLMIESITYKASDPNVTPLEPQKQPSVEQLTGDQFLVVDDERKFQLKDQMIRNLRKQGIGTTPDSATGKQLYIPVDLRKHEFTEEESILLKLLMNPSFMRWLRKLYGLDSDEPVLVSEVQTFKKFERMFMWAEERRKKERAELERKGKKANPKDREKVEALEREVKKRAQQLEDLLKLNLENARSALEPSSAFGFN